MRDQDRDARLHKSERVDKPREIVVIWQVACKGKKTFLGVPFFWPRRGGTLRRHLGKPLLLSDWVARNSSTAVSACSRLTAKENLPRNEKGKHRNRMP